MALEDIEELLEGLRTGVPEATGAFNDLNGILASVSSSGSLTAGMLQNLSTTMREDAAAAAAAAATGASVAQVKKAIADAAGAEAEALKRSTKAADDAANAARRTKEEALDRTLSAISGAGAAAAAAIKGFGDTVKALAFGDIPSASAAMAMFGNMLGGAVAGSGAAFNSTMKEASGVLAKLGPEGAIAAAGLQVLGASVEAVTSTMGAAIGVIATWMGFAIQAAESATMLRAKMDALAGSAAGGAAAMAMISNLAATLPFAKSQINEWAQSLMAAGVKGAQLEADIKAVAAATALMGESGGAAAMTLFKRLGEGGPAADKLLKTFQEGGPKADKLLKEMGLSLADIGGKAALAKMTSEQLHEVIAKAMQKKGAGPLMEMGNTMSVILMKAQEGFRSMFAGMGDLVKPFMAAVKELFGQFNKGTPIAKDLGGVMRDVLTSAFKYATMLVKGISELVKFIHELGKSGALMIGIKIAFAVIAAIVALVTIAVGVLAVVVLALLSPFIVLGAIVVGVAAGLLYLASVIVGALSDAFGGAGDDASSAGSSIMDGLLSGIDPSAFIAKMVDMAAGGLAAFKATLGIASPAKEMIDANEEVGEGAAQGVDKGAPKAIKASAKMAEGIRDAGKPKGGKGGAKGGGEGGGGTTIILNNCTLGSDLTVARAKIVLALAWQELANESGAEPAT